MKKIAIIKTGGKQYKVSEGQVLKVEKLPIEVGASMNFETLLIANDDASEVEVGHPVLGDKVEAKVIEQGVGDKISVIKYKNKTRYTRNVGHRQMFSKVEITKIA